MDLLIDSGNTNTKVGLCSAGSILEVISLKSIETIREIAMQHKPEHIVISSVNKKLDEIEACFPTSKIIRFSSQTPIPVINLYKSPATLGMDRLAGVIGASTLFKGENCLVIDAGTCITYDLIDANQQYRGGSISLGVEMRFKALHTFTAQLPLVDRISSFKLIGGTTEESIQSGVLNGVLMEMGGIIEKYKKEYKVLKIIITGGDAIFFESNLKDSIFVEPKLIFLGLKRILEYNVSKF